MITFKDVDPFCISSEILGSEKHMLVETDGFSFVSSPPANVWFLSGKFKNDSQCLDTLFKLNNLDLPITPETKWINMMSTLMSGSTATSPWSQVMPSSAYKPFVKNILKVVIQNLDRISKNYYNDVWHPCNQVFQSLRPAKVDGPSTRSAIAADPGNAALESFRPGPGGFVQPVVYDRFGTRTGRLVVKTGPSILTLKKDYRQLLTSSFSDGKILSLDFGSLEARIILSENGVNPPMSDLYASLSNELFQGKVSRDTVKTAVLSELYGASKSSLGMRLGMSGSELDQFVDSVRSYFGIPLLKHRLRRNYESTGVVINKYGRKLQVDNPQDNILVNTYAQSTGVDVSLLGFKSVIDRLGTDGIRPLFVLHDALILDVRGDRVSNVEEINSVKVQGYNSEFPLKLEKLHCNF